MEKIFVPLNTVIHEVSANTRQVHLFLNGRLSAILEWERDGDTVRRIPVPDPPQEQGHESKPCGPHEHKSMDLCRRPGDMYGDDHA